MAAEFRNRPQSDLAIPPGEFLAEELAERGMSRRELASRIGRPIAAIHAIIAGKGPIARDTAGGLEEALGIPAHLWISLEVDYRAAEARLR